MTKRPATDSAADGLQLDVTTSPDSPDVDIFSDTPHPFNETTSFDRTAYYFYTSMYRDESILSQILYVEQVCPINDYRVVLRRARQAALIRYCTGFDRNTLAEVLTGILDKWPRTYFDTWPTHTVRHARRFVLQQVLYLRQDSDTPVADAEEVDLSEGLDDILKADPPYVNYFLRTLQHLLRSDEIFEAALRAPRTTSFSQLSLPGQRLAPPTPSPVPVG
jgi:hypothetical protein